MYNTYNRIRAYLFRLLNAKFETESERMKYYSSFISNYDFNSLLDVGCGKGLLFDNIMSLNKSKLLVGVDLIKNRKGQYQHVVVDASSLPFKNNTFSLVTAFSLIEHIPKTEREMFYAHANIKVFIDKKEIQKMRRKINGFDRGGVVCRRSDNSRSGNNSWRTIERAR